MNIIQRFIAAHTRAKPDKKLIIVVGILVVFGLVMLSSASAPLGFERYQDTYYFLWHQMLFGLLPGILGVIFFSLVDYRIWKRYAFLMLILSIALLVLVFIPGIGTKFGTARSWIGIGSLSLQPSEIVKLTFLIYLASWLESRGKHRVGDLHEGLLPFLFSLGGICLLMILQPDFGTMSIIVATAGAVYIIGGAQWKHIVWLVVGGTIGLLLMVQAAPYRAARFTVFLHPELDPQGIGYHINQAFLAIRSGGIFGKGFGLSRQKFQYLPEVMGDSIFAVMSEELGFLFGVGVLFAFGYLMFRGLLIARASRDEFGKLLASGIVFWITFQALVNIGAMAGIMPLTGVPLPFISYGGTALFVNLCAMGILINISRHVGSEQLA